jgi:hypothetical protein
VAKRGKLGRTGILISPTHFGDQDETIDDPSRSSHTFSTGPVVFRMSEYTYHLMRIAAINGLDTSRCSGGIGKC